MKSNPRNLYRWTALLTGLLFALGMVPLYAAQQAQPPAPPESGPAARPGPEAAGWLGVAVENVTAAQAQNLKLPGNYGVFVTRVIENSPAAKAGLKQGDAITEYNGQRVEGTLEFRRMVRETPPGHTAQMTVWREGQSQTISAEMGRPNFEYGGVFPPMPRTFEYERRMPSLPFLRGGETTPMLGISAEDLTVQLGNYFNAPNGQGVLVTEVHPNSPAEKAGLKAGDVIIKINNQPVRNIGDLRQGLDQTGAGKSVTLDLLRDKNEMSVNVTPEAPQPQPLPGAFTGAALRMVI